MKTNSKDFADLNEQEIEEWFDTEDDEPQQRSNLTDEELSKKYADMQVRIVRSTLDFTLHTLNSSMSDRTYINMAPGYQRRARWDRKKKSLLIESILMNVPVPPLFLFENDYNQYEIMDGRQRMEAISDFLANRYSLTGLEFWPELHGKHFDDLPTTIQRGLLRRTINAVVLLAETSRNDVDFDIRMILFRRLNTGGVKLNPQELRNALYPGPFNNAIHELSRCEEFTSVWGIPKKSPDEEQNPPQNLLKNILYRSMMDCELVLRFFAIKDAANGLSRGALRQILDQTLSRHNKSTDAEIETKATDFKATLNRLIQGLGKDFHKLPKDSKPSRPLYDALMVATSESPEIDLNINSTVIKSRLSTALNTPAQYEILVGRGNTLDSIKERVDLAKTIVRGI